jgi:hypothetical protein
VRATGRRRPHARASSKTASVVSDRGNLAFPGSVRVYIIKPLVCDSSTGALTSFRWVDRSIQVAFQSRPTFMSCWDFDF